MSGSDQERPSENERRMANFRRLTGGDDALLQRAAERAGEPISELAARLLEYWTGSPDRGSSPDVVRIPNDRELVVRGDDAIDTLGRLMARAGWTFAEAAVGHVDARADRVEFRLDERPVRELGLSEVVGVSYDGTSQAVTVDAFEFRPTYELRVRVGRDRWLGLGAEVVSARPTRMLGYERLPDRLVIGWRRHVEEA